jgi:hypothetical protein
MRLGRRCMTPPAAPIMIPEGQRSTQHRARGKDGCERRQSLLGEKRQAIRYKVRSQFARVKQTISNAQRRLRPAGDFGECKNPSGHDNWPKCQNGFWILRPSFRSAAVSVTAMLVLLSRKMRFALGEDFVDVVFAVFAVNGVVGAQGDLAAIEAIIEQAAFAADIDGIIGGGGSSGGDTNPGGCRLRCRRTCRRAMFCQSQKSYQRRQN